nr:TPA_inf: conotoxin precursor B1 [Conus ebraeus]
MQSFTCMCLLVPLLFFHLAQRSDTAGHGGAATDVRSADHTLKRFHHDFRQAPKRRSNDRYDRRRSLSMDVTIEFLSEGVREASRERAEDSREASV